MRILVVHEVNYLSKIIYEFQILPEILSILGHDLTIVDYDDVWQRDTQNLGSTLRTSVYHGVHRAYPQASVTVRRPGVVRLPLISRISGALTATYEIRRVIRDKKPDAILLYGIPTIGLQTLLLARSYRIPVICRSIDVTHELVPNRLLVPATHVLAKQVYLRSDLNVALTPHLKEYIQSYGVSESRIRLLPSGVDTEIFCPGPRNNRAVKAYGIEENHRVILFMGTMYKFSGLDSVIRDFPRLVAQHPNARLVIAGTGEDENRLKRMAADLGMTSHVIFTGLLTYGELPDLIRASDVCINPFELNGATQKILPTKLFQYLACAKPVLATELPGTLLFLKGEEHGVVYAPLKGFVDQLSEVLFDADRMKRLADNGAAAAQIYDWKEIAETMVKWIQALIQEAA